MVKKYSVQMRKAKNIEFPVLQDPGNKVGSAFGLRFELPYYLRELYEGFGLDLPRFNGDDSWTLSMPAGYVIGKDGTVVRAEYDPDYTMRPEPVETLEFLRGHS